MRRRPDLPARAISGVRSPSDVTDALVPALRPGDTAIRDTLRAHTVVGVREAVEAAGARLLCFPPDSPNVTPIEPAFAKLKHLLRTAATRNGPRPLQRHPARLHPQACRNHLAAAGYEDDLVLAA